MVGLLHQWNMMSGNSLILDIARYRR